MIVGLWGYKKSHNGTTEAKLIILISYSRDDPNLSRSNATKTNIKLGIIPLKSFIKAPVDMLLSVSS